MFEVGKKYGGKTYDPKYEWTCLAVDGNKAWLKFTGTIAYYADKDGLFDWHNNWKEIKPRVKVTKWAVLLWTDDVTIVSTDPRSVPGKPMEKGMWYPDTGTIKAIKEIEIELEEGEGLV